MADGRQDGSLSDDLKAPEQGREDRDNIEMCKGSMGDLQGCYAIESLGQQPNLTVVETTLLPVLVNVLAFRRSGS